MSNNKKQAAADQEEVAKFDKQTLIEAYETLGAAREVVVGALYDMKNPMTLDEAKECVKAFLERPIQNDEGGK